MKNLAVTLILALCSVPALAQEAALPDAPSAVVKQAARKPGFFTVRRPDEPKLRTTRQVLLSKSFIAEEVLMWGAAFYNVEATRNQRQNPPIPRHAELYIDAYVPLIPISVFHFLARKYICQCVGDIPVAYATAWHGYNAVKGYYP